MATSGDSEVVRNLDAEFEGFEGRSRRRMSRPFHRSKGQKLRWRNQIEKARIAGERKHWIPHVETHDILNQPLSFQNVSSATGLTALNLYTYNGIDPARSVELLRAELRIYIQQVGVAEPNSQALRMFLVYFPGPTSEYSDLNWLTPVSLRLHAMCPVKFNEEARNHDFEILWEGFWAGENASTTAWNEPATKKAIRVSLDLRGKIASWDPAHTPGTPPSRGQLLLFALAGDQPTENGQYGARVTSSILTRAIH
jgi:hypothetical protein